MTSTGANPEGDLKVRLVAARYAARDTNLYEFVPVDGQPLPPVQPGAHIDIHLPNGMMRQYSLVVPGDRPSSYIVGVKRDPASRGGSRFLHDDLRLGTVLKISRPRCLFPLEELAEHTVLIAGGIGITPIWCMAQRLQQLGASWEMHYATRSRDDAAFAESLAELAPVRFNFDDENQGQFLDLPGIVASAPAGAHFYCCGPLPMLDAFEKATAALPPNQVHVEYFSPKQAADTEGGYMVKLARSGLEFTIPAGKTILDVLRDAGVDVPYSCEQGICGACETRIVSGEPDHRDSILTEAEQKAGQTMMICCSGSKSPELVLDL